MGYISMRVHEVKQRQNGGRRKSSPSMALKVVTLGRQHADICATLSEWWYREVKLIQ